MTDSPTSPVRTFVAVKVPDTVINQIAGLQKEIKREGFGARWTRPETIHLTLKFLGDIARKDVDPVCQKVAAAAAGHAPVTLCASGAGCFPSVRKARVLWTGIAGETDRLARLHQAVDRQLHELGFAPDPRRFTGHLTLARFKNRFGSRVDAEALINMMTQYAHWRSDEFTADAVYVMQSDLTPSGPIYRDLSRISLDG